jgi:imidazolonepropionase-like amidohydrolase
MRLIVSSALVCLAAIGAIAAQQGESPIPPLPADIPKNAAMRLVLMDGKPTGQDAVWKAPDGSTREFFQFNDRGRGPKLYIEYGLDDGGFILSEQSKGVDYMKTPVEERFSLTAGAAAWKNQAEDEKQANAKGKFYIDINSGMESTAILARALLMHGGSLPLLPSGTATIRQRQSLPVEGAGRKRAVTLYEIGGLSFTPIYLWLTDEKQFFASIFGGGAIIEPGFEAAAPALRESQREIESQHSAELAQRLTHRPPGDLVIANATIFHAEDGKLLANQRVTVKRDRIASVEPDRGQAAPPGAQVIDGKGKMLLPGLWDMHAHLYAENAFLDMATGVTTVRDLGNPIDGLTRLRKLIDEGQQIGPRVIPAGFIDGPGPFEGPIKALAATPEEALQWVDRYADLGYVQIKIYSSVKPELVPVIAAEAHKRGLRVSGHVPAGMIAEQFVRAGADEVQHMNFIFLNFMPDVKETRTPARFIEPGTRGASLDLNSQAVNDFIAFLKQHHTVIDPTMGVWEDTYLDRPGVVGKIDAPMFERLPVQVQRATKTASQALGASDAGTDRAYRASYANMIRMLKKLYDSGVQIVAGTDAESGYAFDRELEIYQEAGIPAVEVLRMATIEAARVMHRDADLGSISPGKLADMILVNGDPAAHIGDIRHVDTVIKNGEIYRPAELYPAFGIKAQ